MFLPWWPERRWFNMTTPSSKKVLVVDDFEGVAKLVKEAIEDVNYTVKTACSAEDGYRTYLRFKPDIVITDIEMGGKSGFELVDDIRSIDPEIKVIFMSGYSSGEGRFDPNPFIRIHRVHFIPIGFWGVFAWHCRFQRCCVS
jgi:CheY-like chemotaxis protein